MTRSGEPAVFAVDGGNSKAEAILVAADGRLLAAVRSGTVSHQQVGLPGTVTGLSRLASAAAAAAASAAARRATSEATSAATSEAEASAPPFADVGSYCLAGADFPAEIGRLRRAIQGRGLTRRLAIRNDTLAALRAGATRPWGVALICGQGVNGIGVGPTGRTARFDALGEISGDWGGGTSVSWAGLAAAVRAADGRGPRTDLRRRVAAHFGRRSIGAVVHDLYAGRLDESRVGELSPLVFEVAAAGDAAALGIVDRLAEELATMALALLRRTGQTRLDPEVILAGGVARAGRAQLLPGVTSRIQAVSPAASVRVLDEPPVLGAGLLGLEDLGLSSATLDAAERRLREDMRGVAFAAV